MYKQSYSNNLFESNRARNESIDMILKAIDNKREHRPLELVPIANASDSLTCTTTHIWSR
jgi:hypothetical protein